MKGTASARKDPVVAVVLAGGVGERTGLSLPKQLIRIAGKPVIEHTIAALEESGEFDEIIVMMAPGYETPVQQILDSGAYPAFRAVYSGGQSRNDTSALAVQLLLRDHPRQTKVLFHDAVRPFIDPQTLHRLVDALEGADAADTVIPSADTLVEVDEHADILAIPNRSRFRRGQTPQAFRLGVIADAYEKAQNDPEFEATDDCAVVWMYLPGTRIVTVPGTAENMKITEKIDFSLADTLFQLRAAHDAPLPESALQRYFSGRIIAIIGGSEGIGAAIANRARAFGACVEVFSRTTTGTHIQSRNDVRSALKQCADAHGGRVDDVVASAGALVKRTVLEASDADITEALGVNLVGPLLVAQEAHDYLKQAHGNLLLFTSSSYTRGRPGYALYSSAKAAVVNLTQALAGEWDQDEICVNCINPERTKTPMRVQAFGVEPDESLLTAQHVARTALDTLARDLTGQVVSVRRWEQQVS